MPAYELIVIKQFSCVGNFEKKNSRLEKIKRLQTFISVYKRLTTDYSVNNVLSLFKTKAPGPFPEILNFFTS
jgi:hypothetical protein